MEISPVQQIGAALFVFGALAIVAVAIFIHRYQAAEKAKENTMLKQIAYELGVSEEKAQQIAVNRLYAQFFPGQEATPEVFMQAGQVAPSQARSTQTLDDLIARAAK